MVFKDKVYKVIVEMGEEKTIKDISNAISTRAFFDLKEKFEKLEKNIIEEQNKKFIEKLHGWEKEIRTTIGAMINEEIAEKLKK